MKRRHFLVALAAAIPVPAGWALAEARRIHRIGIVLLGGPYMAAVDGLRKGLKEAGMGEGSHFVLNVRNVDGDLKLVGAAASSLETEGVDLIFSVATSVTLATAKATKITPIVFYVGSDPVKFGLVASLSNPSGRMTGLHGRFTEMAGKRLQLLKEMLPNLRRVVTFYTPHNPSARESIKEGRLAARQLGIELIERLVSSVDGLRAGLAELRPGEVDAFYYVADGMVTSQSSMVIEAARTKGLPTMFADVESVRKGALASYGVHYEVLGRHCARYVEQVLRGRAPGSLPVEQFDYPQLVINLKTAKVLGISIPDTIIVRAHEIIE